MKHRLCQCRSVPIAPSIAPRLARDCRSHRCKARPCHPPRPYAYIFTLRGPATVEPLPSCPPRHCLAGLGHRPRPGTQSGSCPLSAGRRRQPAAPCLPRRHARARARFGACADCSDSIRVLGLLPRPPTGSCSRRRSPDPALRSVRRAAASRPC